MYGNYGYNYGYGYGYDDSALIGLLAGNAFLIILWLALAVVLLIAWGRLLSKAGHHGALILVPVYGAYLQYKIADATGIFWFQIIGAVVSAVMAYISLEVAAVVSIIYLVICVITSIVYEVKLARAFGKGGGFAAGLIFLNPIFVMILAFGSAEHESAVYRRIAFTASNWECQYCGTTNSESSLYCSTCGKEKPRA